MTTADALDDEHPTILGTLREMPTTVRVLIVGTLISNLAAFLNAFLVLFFKGQGYSSWECGAILTALMVGRIFGSGVGGGMADRFGYRWTIVGSMTGTAVTTALLVHVPNLWTAVLVSALAGLTGTAFRPASMAWIVELTPKNQQVMVFSILRLTFNIGATVGPLGAALLLGYFSYGVLFYVDALTSLAFGVVAFVLLAPDGARAKADKGPTAEDRAGYREVLADRRFVLVVAGLFLTAIAYVQSSAALPLYITGSGHDERFFAVLLAVNGAIVIIFEVLLSKWLQRVPIGVPMAAGMAVLGLGHLMYFGWDSVPVLVIATVVWTFGEVIAAPSMMAYPGLVAPKALRARYIGAAQVPQQIGYALGPVIGVAAWGAWKDGVWVLTGGCAVVAALLVAVGAGLRRRAPAKDTEQPPAGPGAAKAAGASTESE